MRKIIHSVTCFIHCEQDWLFIHRTKKGHASDFGRLNGVGGKVEPGEKELDAAVREIAEETGYLVEPSVCQLKVKVMMTGGYPEDWRMSFYRVEVSSKHIPLGSENDEGQLIWLPESEVLHTSYRLVDDIYYCFDHIRSEETRIMQVEAEADQNEEICRWHATLTNSKS